ncbi:MAG: ATP-dependent Clp protease adaptor ClpS, partial [Ktedonobacterales bacterium]
GQGGCDMAGIFGRNAARVPVSRSAAPRTDDEVLQLLRLLPRYRVLLFNDDHNSMDRVVLALVRTITGMDVERAMRVMLEAHTTGCAQVIVCLKEQAEHYREMLEQYGLTSTIEPA